MIRLRSNSTRQHAPQSVLSFLNMNERIAFGAPSGIRPALIDWHRDAPGEGWDDAVRPVARCGGTHLGPVPPLGLLSMPEYRRGFLSSMSRLTYPGC
jgi:hypothetical protein